MKTSRRSFPLFVMSPLMAVVMACGSAAAPESDAGAGDAGDGSFGPATSPNGLPLPDDAAAPPMPAATSATFVPFQRDFQGFSAWIRFELGSEQPVGDGVVHLSGKRVIYINRLPPAGARVFEAGTIIVKETQTGEILARVKRGGEYNKGGSLGWEWFELKRVDSEWLIVWRGITPPAGFCYGGIVGGVCNDCHRAFAHNDFVAASVLDLSKL